MKLLLLIPALLLPRPQPQTLASLTGTHRVLLVFALSATAPKYQQQIDQLQHHAAEFKNRDLILMPVLSQAADPYASETLGQLPLATPSAPEQQALRSRFHIAPDNFTVVLIGKDGGEKLRQSQPITIDTLTRTIDAMPMRQQEMRGKQN